MSRPAVTAVGFLLVLGACDGLGERLRTEPGGELGRDIIIADTVDAALLRPGTVLRFGPAADHVVQGPLYSPVVVGDRGQVSIYEGFFVPEPCARSLRADADREGDTITVRVIARPDTTAGPCQEGDRPLGYAMLVGQFDPGTYAVRLIHEGDTARDAPLDTIYDDITIAPRER